MHEQRPVYRIAAAGLDPRDVRLIEIVFKHSQYNRFEFLLDDGSDPHSVDVLLVNTAVPEGLQAVSAVRKLPRHVPVVAAVPRGVPSPARHAISIDRLTLQLLPILNRVVESELLSPDTQPMTVPLPHDDAQFEAAWPQPGAPARLPATNAPATNAPPAARLAAAGPAPVAPAAAAAASSTAASAASANTAAPAVPTTRTAPTIPPATTSATASARAATRPGAGQPAATAGGARSPQPAAPAAPATPDSAGARDGGPRVDPALRRPRILVVDDSPTVRQQLGIAFTRMGFVCEMVASGEVALSRLAAGAYQLVMVDVMIPDMDGYRLTREIRKRHRGTPVIILSSRGSPFDHARGLLAGCKAYLAKPVPLRELEAAILKTLRKSLAAGELEQLLRNAAAARAAAARGAAVRAAAPAASVASAVPAGRPAQPASRPAAAPMAAEARA